MRPIAAATLLPALLAGCAGSGAAVGTPTAADPRPTVAAAPSVAGRPVVPGHPPPGERWGAALHQDTRLLAAPRDRAHSVVTVRPRTGFGSPTVLAVVGQRGEWLGVLAPDLGNGRVGWVRAADIELLKETWAIDIDLSRRQAVLEHFGKRYLRFAVAVGTPTYSTPTGRFGVTDLLRPGDRASPYGCCVLALSARQPHIAQDWPGGDRIAIHGTTEPASIGTAASHGCVRADRTAMRVLMKRVPLGTPVVIHA